MTVPARFRIPSSVSLILLLLVTGCSSIDEQEGPAKVTGTFPVPPEIQDNVAFWRKVYGEWSRGEVAIHDDEYMGLIYEVVDLPGPTRSGYTAEQKRFVRARKAHYQSRLKGIESKVRSGRSPSGYEKVLYEKLVDAGGKRAIYGAADRVRIQRGLRERFHRGLEISGRYDAKFREVFRSKGLPEDLAYLPHVESSFQAHAHSSAGAAGMWQFTRGTGKRYMTVNGAVDERLDPVIAAEGAARYLGGAYRMLGSWPLAVTSYNHGQGGMQKAKAIYGDDIGAIVRKYKGPHFKFASRNFYAEFIAARQVASNPKQYFPGGVHYQAPLSEDRLVLRYSMRAPRLASHYGLPTYRLANLNLHWRGAALKGRVDLPAGTTVWLPAGTLDRVANVPAPPPVLVAKAQPKPEIKAIQVTQAEPKRKPTKVAKVQSKPLPVKSQTSGPPKTAKVHVVKPHETLYRVATYYELSVDELRRLNRMGPKDTNIYPGQRLRVSG